MTKRIRQLRIVHLSDIHFGDSHRFNPPSTPSGDRAAAEGWPQLTEMLRRDWLSDEWRTDEWYSDDEEYPLIVALTGDLTDSIDAPEVKQVEDFMASLCDEPILGSRVDREHIFVVPGNHDVIFLQSDKNRRWQPYCSLYQDFFGVRASAKAPEKLSRVRDYSKKYGLIAVELNSCVYVTKGSQDETRGQIDIESLASIRDELQEIPAETLSQCMKIAFVHHHPIVLPALAEPGRGYDAIINSDMLLGILQDFGFHLILHGHKHYPHTFSYDALCAWTEERVQPLMVIAGGSVAGRKLPEKPRARNTYNMITYKWLPEAGQARIKVVTRALVAHDEKGRDSLPMDWHWETLRVDDRRLSPYHNIPVPADGIEQAFTEGSVWEEERTSTYKRLKGNMPVVEVMPSLMPGQAYEARVWIVPHPWKREIPTEVIWTAGQKFGNPVVCRRDDNPNFSSSFHYWDSMLIQARMRFADGTSEAAHVYARIPREYETGVQDDDT